MEQQIRTKEKHTLSGGKSILIFFIAIIALLAEFVLYFMLGIGAAFSDDVGSLSVLAMIFGSLMLLTGLIGVIAIICAIVSKFTNGERISYNIMYYTIVIGLILLVLTNVAFAIFSKPAIKAASVDKSGKVVATDTLSVALIQYKDKVVVSNVSVGKTILDEDGVFGEIKNTGNRTLDLVELTIYALDKDGKTVFEKSGNVVHVSEWSINDDGPLKPNYSRKFGVDIDEAPSDWSKQVKVVVSKIGFQKPDTDE